MQLKKSRSMAFTCLFAVLAGCASTASPSVEEGEITSALNISPDLLDIPLEPHHETLLWLNARTASPAGCLSGVVLTPGTDGAVDVTGVWQQTRLPASLTVGGRLVTVKPDRTWTVRLPVSNGLNQFRAVSRDADGRAFNNICAVYAGPQTVGDKVLENAVVLGLRQGGIDDGAPNLPVGSVGDVLRAVLASEGLHQLLHAELLANLEKVHILTTDTVFSPEVNWYYEYRSLSFDAPRLSVSLRNGALAVSVHIDNLRVNAELFRDGKVFSSHRDFNTIIDSVDARFDLKLAFKNGRIEVEATAEPDGIDLSEPNFEGEGIIGEAIEFAADSFGAGPARKALEKALKKGIEKNMPTALEKVLNNAVGAGLATHVDVPNIGRPGNTRLTFDANLGGLSVRSGGMLRVDFDTTVKGPETKPVDAVMAAPATKTLPEHFTAIDRDECKFECHGLPHQCLRELEEAQRCLTEFRRESAGGVSPALVGQALHALWRADYFNFDNAGPALGLNLSGIGQLDLDMLMPPAVFGTANGVRVFVGPVTTRIVRTGQPTLEGQLYARIDVPVVLSGDRSIAFGTPNVANVGFDPRGISGLAAFVLPPIVESGVQAVLEASLRRALAGVDPVALPAYRVPASLSNFGLPANAEFGVRPDRIEGSEGFLTLIGRVREL